MSRKHTDNIETPRILNEYRDEDGNLDGIQFYMLDDRRFNDLLLDWMIANGYSMEEPQKFLSELGLERYISVSDWHALMCGTSVPGARLASQLSGLISESLGITVSKVISYASVARNENWGGTQVEIPAGVRVDAPKPTAAQHVRQVQENKKSDFGTLLRAYMDRTGHTHHSLNVALRASHPKAGGQVSRWLAGTRRPMALTIKHLRECLNLTEEEHDQLIRKSWKDHLQFWEKQLKKARVEKSFGGLLKAHYKLTFAPDAFVPYTTDGFAKTLGVSTHKLINIEQEISFPDAPLFEKICATLQLSDSDISDLAQAVGRTTRAKALVQGDVGLLEMQITAGEHIEQYTELAKLYRYQTGMSVADMVDTLGVKRDLVTYLEQGKRIARPETRQQLKDYLAKLKVSPAMQGRMVYAMDYTTLGIAKKQTELDRVLSKQPYDFPSIFRWCRETTLKPDGGIGLTSYREAAELLVEQGAHISQGTLRNWELTLGQRIAGAEGKTVKPDMLQPYMDMIQVPCAVQAALLEQIAAEKAQRKQSRAGQEKKYHASAVQPGSHVSVVVTEGPLMESKKTSQVH